MIYPNFSMLPSRSLLRHWSRALQHSATAAKPVTRQFFHTYSTEFSHDNYLSAISYLTASFLLPLAILSPYSSLYSLHSWLRCRHCPRWYSQYLNTRLLTTIEEKSFTNMQPNSHTNRKMCSYYLFSLSCKKDILWFTTDAWVPFPSCTTLPPLPAFYPRTERTELQVFYFLSGIIRNLSLQTLESWGKAPC